MAAGKDLSVEVLASAGKCEENVVEIIHFTLFW